MQLFTHPDFDDHEQVVFVRDAAAGLRAIIAVHDTTLGPALGGCRIWPYADEGAALTDALRLSHGMTYKAALAGLALGGGKSVVMADARTEKTPDMMRAIGRAVERLGGRYIVAEDVGTTVADMDEVAKETTYLAGSSASMGDPSPWTAQGVLTAMQAGAAHRWGGDLAGRTVSVTGLGHVGAGLCRRLAGAGARLIVSDIRDERVRQMVEETGATPISPQAAHVAEADILAPCALGAGLNATTIPEIRAGLICGSANNQLAEPEDGRRLAARGILYAPDYLVNAGGLISAALASAGQGRDAINAKVEAIGSTLRRIFELAAQQGLTPEEAADRLAESRFRHAA